MSANAPVPAAYRASVQAALSEIAVMVSGITDFTAPGLGSWDLGGLVGHFLRAVRTPLDYLAAPEPAGPPLPGAAHYAAAYLDRRDQDSSRMDQSVATRGTRELADDTRHPAEALREESQRLAAVLKSAPAGRLVATPFGAVRLDDYLRTRAMEITVHGTDIAHALGEAWTPPQALLADTIRLLGEIAILRGSAVDLIRVLTGRTPPEPGEVVPILR
jgi:hypothetical protein